MSRSLSWIDPETLAASLARAGVGAAHGHANSAVAPGTVAVPGAMPGGYASSPGHPVASAAVGLSSAVVATPETINPSPSTTAAALSAAGPSPSSTAAEPTTVAAAKAAAGTPDPVMEAFEPPASRLHARLEAFMEWVERHVPCQEIFIVDEEGLVLMERNSDPTLIAVSSYFLNFNERIRSSLGAQSQGAIAIDLEGGRTLHVVQAETALGPHALGFTSAHPMHRNVNESFRNTLPVVFAQDAA